MLQVALFFVSSSANFFEVAERVCTDLSGLACALERHLECI